MKPGFGPHSDSFLEFLFQLFKSPSLFIVEKIGNLWMNRHGRFGTANIEHFPPQFAEYFVTNRYFRFDVTAPLAVAARLAHHAADVLAHPFSGQLDQPELRDFQNIRL